MKSKIGAVGGSLLSFIPVSVPEFLESHNLKPKPGLTMDSLTFRMIVPEKAKLTSLKVRKQGRH